MANMSIKILPNGPYEVTGGVPLDEQVIRPDGHGYTFEPGREFEQKETYYLCRCGRSENAPFCDGAHSRTGFTASETASREPYIERARTYDGPVIDLLDDERCAFARFCHHADCEGEASEVWGLAAAAETEEEVKLAATVAGECPAGRLTARTREGNFLEPELDAGVSIIQDPQKRVSAGIYVHGGIPIVGADGEEYELRNRYMICRCGASRSKPFCDAFHVPIRFNDGHVPSMASED